MLLQGGKWNDEQILPQGWVEYSTTPTNAFSGYGAGWVAAVPRQGFPLSIIVPWACHSVGRICLSLALQAISFHSLCQF